MSLRVDASGDQIKRTTAVPVTTAFSVVGFGRVIAAPAGGALGCVFTLADASNNTLIYWDWDDSGGSVSEFGSYNGATFSAVNPASRPAVGTDFVFCITCSGTGANLLKLQWRALTSTTWVTGTATLQTGTATQLWIGNDTSSEWLSSRYTSVKVWDAALTAAELDQEASVLRPVRFTNLHAWWPMFDMTLANNLIDYSGNGKTLTSAGTLTMEDGVPVSYGAGVISHPGSAGGAVNTPVSAQATTTPTKSLTLLPGKFLQATTTPAKSLVRAFAKALQASSSPVASLSRAFAKLLQATTSPVASESGARVKLQSAQGQTSPVASIVKQTGKPLQAITAPVASIVKSTAKALQATTTPAKSFSALKVFLKAAQASTSPVASLSRAKQTAQALQATTAPVASLLRVAGKVLRTTTAPVASLVRSTAKTLQATATRVASLSTARQRPQAAQATTSPVASNARQFGKAITAATSAVASLVRRTGKPLSASTAPVASMTKGGSTTRAAQATTSPVATLGKARGKALQATASVVAKLRRSFQATFDPGIYGRAYSRTVAALGEARTATKAMVGRAFGRTVSTAGVAREQVVGNGGTAPPPVVTED